MSGVYIDATDHAGWYVKPFGGRSWGVYNDRRGALFIDLADTRVQALALAWKLRTAEDRLYEKQRAAADRRTPRRGFFARLFGGGA